MQAGSAPQVQDYFSDLQTPDIQQLILEDPQLAASISPEIANAIMAGPTAYGNISLDPAYKKAQMDALAQLQDITSGGGLSDIERADLNKIGTEEATRARGAREAILQNAQARGVGGSGLEMMAQLQNAQDAATRQSARDTDVAAQARQRALQALVQQGQMASQMRGQEYGEKSDLAKATDAISLFNAGLGTDVNKFNAGLGTDVKKFNTTGKQDYLNRKTDIHNAQAVKNWQIPQQQFENEIKKRGGQSGTAGTNAQIAGGNADRTANAQNQTIGTGLTAAALFMSDEREKENVKPFDASNFLNSITAHKFNYKKPENGVGPHISVMAQDLEKTPEGSNMVVDTPNGKMVDTKKVAMASLAGLTDLHRRLKELEDEKV